LVTVLALRVKGVFAADYQEYRTKSIAGGAKPTPRIVICLASDNRTTGAEWKRSSARHPVRKDCLILCRQTTTHTQMNVAGFDWDDGNWPKCGKHGVSREDIEYVLLGKPAVMADPHPEEPRMRAIGKTAAGRYVFLVFMLREIGGQTMLRPISARFMHQKEVAHYENQA
jgi:uncharacterized DUF497 family protein